MKALISGIKRMETHDGDGLRTTIFFKGCPLRCIWCHNPESISFSKQIAYFQEKCIACGSCKAVCLEQLLNDLIPPFPSCSFCGKCTEICPTNALTEFGREYDLETLLREVLQDEPFFRNGAGGVTLSGGECLAQPRFIIPFAKALKERNISVFVDTCGYVPRKVFSDILPYTDTFLYDIKAFNEAVHIRLTGKSNRLIFDNLRYLLDENANVEIRYPLVKGVNDHETENIATYLSKISKPLKIKILQYHNFAGSRYSALGLKNTLPQEKTTYEDVEYCVKLFQSYGLNAVNGASE